MLTRMREVTLFVGGSVGSDPYSPRTWSGISAFLIAALERQQLLDKAVGVRVSKLTQYSLMLKNFSRNRAAWRKHFYFDPAYRNALTRAARSIPVQSETLLQVGHLFSLPEAFPDKRCVSYHDGNLPELLASGYGLDGVSRKRIDQALRYEEAVAGQMTLIFTFSEYLRQSFIRDYRVSPERVVNVGGAINLTEIPPIAPGKSYTAKRLLFVGVEFERKGGPQLLEALQIVRQTHPTTELHIVGPQALAVIWEGVVFHGNLSKADPAQKRKLQQLFEESTLFVMPSLYEPFGIAPLEAMLYQLPCVLTDAWALREHVTPGINGELVEKGSVDDLAAKLIAMLNSPDRLAAMGARARDMVLARYTWDAVVARMVPYLRPI